MKFSVLVPVYNVEKYLRQCLDAIATQSFQDFEVILADDGSIDGSGQICDAYALKYPTKFKVFHKDNEGLLLTRRFSLKHAQGDYIVFVDSDDYVAPDLLETLNNTFEEHKCDMVIYNFYRFCDGDENFDSPEIPYADGTVFEGENKRELYERFVLTHVFVNMWVKAVKREAVDIDFDYTKWNVSRGEDVIQSFPLFDQAQKIVFIDKRLYYYRKNGSSVTAKVRKEDYKNYLTGTARTYDYIEKWNLSPDIPKKYAAWQMSRFYHYLRDVEKKARKEGNEDLLAETIAELGSDERYQKIWSNYDTKYSAFRIRSRLVLLGWFMKHKNWAGVKALIRFSNVLVNAK